MVARARKVRAGRVKCMFEVLRLLQVRFVSLEKGRDSREGVVWASIWIERTLKEGKILAQHEAS